MTRKIYLVLSCAVFFSNLMFAQQHFTLRAKMTYNYFSAEDLRTLQDQTLSYLTKAGLPVKAVESFPPYYGMQFQMLLPIKDSAKINAGLFYEQFSTGGRIHYEDYSGEIVFDQILNARSLGAIIEKNFELNSFLGWSLDLRVSYIFISLKAKTYNRIYHYEQNDITELQSRAIGIAPGMSVSFNLYRFVLCGSIGYQASLSSGFKYAGQKVKNEITGKEIFPGLDGLRLGAGLGFSL